MIWVYSNIRKALYTCMYMYIYDKYPDWHARWYVQIDQKPAAVPEVQKCTACWSQLEEAEGHSSSFSSRYQPPGSRMFYMACWKIPSKIRRLFPSNFAPHLLTADFPCFMTRQAFEKCFRWSNEDWPFINGPYSLVNNEIRYLNPWLFHT